MSMDARIEAVAVPLSEAAIDTGTIFPSRFLRLPRGSGYQDMLFRDRRYAASGQILTDFPLNKPPYAGAKILVARKNFGCGSSRENAVFALLDFGIRCIIAPSFGQIFFLNCIRNGLAPVILGEDIVERILRHLSLMPGANIVIDLHEQVIQAAGERIEFPMEPAHKKQLLTPQDRRALALCKLDTIRAFETRYFDEFPWLSK